MAVERSTFKVWSFECAGCGAKRQKLQWDYEPAPSCCEQPMDLEQGPQKAHAVIGDEIDIVIKHGMCDEHTGEPKRWRSRSELRREEIRRGWTKYGETPHVARD